jgi:dihydrofolate reductase
MTAFVYYTATSVNGFIADEGNSLDWLFEVVGADDASASAFMSGVGIQVMGSTTYAWLLEHENLLQEPQKWAAFFGSLPTRIFSSRDLPVPAGADVQFLRGPVGEHAERLRERAEGKDVWIVGGGDLAGQFLDAGHLDRIELTVAPAFLTGGAPLLPRRIASSRVRLVAAEMDGPFARLVYAVSG